MSVRKSGAFVADVERQFEWYVLNADWEVAERYLAAVEADLPTLGATSADWEVAGGFAHPRLENWRFFVVFRPFKKHVVFYELIGDDVIMRRAIPGHRDLPRRLLEPPGAE